LHIPSILPTGQASTDCELARGSRNSPMISFLNSDSDSGWFAHLFSAVSRGHVEACWIAGKSQTFSPLQAMIHSLGCVSGKKSDSEANDIDSEANVRDVVSFPLTVKVGTHGEGRSLVIPLKPFRA
jgi:hypothetical protein